MSTRSPRSTGDTPEPTPGLTRFNTADDQAALAALHEVCASRAWGGKVLAQRPYATADALFAASDAAMAELTAEDLAEAMAGHPPIGRPKPGDPTSRREQSGMAGASEALKGPRCSNSTWPTRRSSGMSS